MFGLVLTKPLACIKNKEKNIMRTNFWEGIQKKVETYLLFTAKEK
jgi:hypothetical protein